MKKRSLSCTIFGALAALGLVLAAAGCGPAADSARADGAGPDPVEPPKQQPLPVVATSVIEGPITSWILASGNLEAIEIVDVLAKVPGQIDHLPVEEGTEVAAGDVLLQLDAVEYQLSVDRAETEVEKRRGDLERFDRMLAEELISQTDYDQARYELRQTELALQQASIDLKETVVRSPIAGVVSSRLVHRGERVTANQHLFTVVDPRRLWVHLHAPEADLPGLRAGLEATLVSDVLPGRSFTGKVDRVSPVVDPSSGTGKVTVAIGSNDGRLRPGMFVNAKIVTDERSHALLIPKRAVIYPGDRPAVYRVDKDEDGQHVATLVSIVLGNNSGERVEVREGLTVGEKIVILGQDGLRSGIPIRLVDGGSVGLPLLPS